jgi:filamentous hemagglutinin
MLVYAGAPLSADGTTNTKITVAPNGVPVVNIAPPSSGGVSHNKYRDYNVDALGLILNNSKNDGELTTLGGRIAANPNVKNNSAEVIMNEVTSTNRTNMSGFTEVAGKGAAVIIANPNGITCEGCGFINSNRTTLITGRSNPDFNTFSISSYGDIEIRGGSLYYGYIYRR